MKLINKAILQYLLVSVPLIICAIIISFVLIRKELRDGADETLLDEKIKAELILPRLKTRETVYLSADSIARIESVTFHADTIIYQDTAIFNLHENELIAARQLKAFVNTNGQTHLISLYKSQLEEDELLEAITITIGLIFLFLMIAFLTVTLLLSEKNWKSFYSTLGQLKQYDLSKPETIQLDKSKIKEFEELNAVLSSLLAKLHKDFRNQKEFTENASHELQTPLAIIKANINLLIQSSNLGEDDMEQIQAIENTVQRISSLNKTLLLLSKIENQQFIEKTDVDITNIIENLLSRFAHQLNAKHLEVYKQLSESTIVEINKELAEILISNLIQNAIKHNVKGGEIHIKCGVNFMEISNSGLQQPLAEHLLFRRFYKGSISSDSNGLGLAIVKSIVDISNITIQYYFTAEKHTFQLLFHK